MMTRIRPPAGVRPWQGRGAWLVACANVFAWLLAAPGGSEAAATDTRPNIIFILADDLGYGELGCYGQKDIRTPNLDRAAGEGVRFTQCYAGCTVCAPSRCALLTGLHTGHAWVRGNGSKGDVPLRPDEVTVARLLRQAGYTTAVIGKWGLGKAGSTGAPSRQGFDYSFGYLDHLEAHNYYPEYLWKNEKKHPLAGNVARDYVASRRAQYSHDVFTREALDYISGRREKPFFLYLAYTIPHCNWYRGDREGNGMEVPDDAPYSDRPWPQAQKNHAAMITRLDRDVGRILHRLRETGLDRRTVVFFSSDNGPHKEGGADPKFFHSSGPLRGYKRDLYEGGIRVPMIARWPGRIQAGRVSDQVWVFWDFLPTAAELAGAKAPPGLDGISMVPALLGAEAAGRAQQAHDYLYWELHEGGFHQAVRAGKWKAVRRVGGSRLELYNLETDPGESSDVAARHPGMVARLEDYLRGARTESANWPVPRQ